MSVGSWRIRPVISSQQTYLSKTFWDSSANPSPMGSALKPHYIISDYGFNSEPDIDGSTGPRRYIRPLNRRWAAPPRLSNIFSWGLSLFCFVLFFTLTVTYCHVTDGISVKHCIESMPSALPCSAIHLGKTAVYFPKMDGGFAASTSVTFLHQAFMEGKLCRIPQFVVCVA